MTEVPIFDSSAAASDWARNTPDIDLAKFNAVLESFIMPSGAGKVTIAYSGFVGETTTLHSGAIADAYAAASPLTVRKLESTEGAKFLVDNESLAKRLITEDLIARHLIDDNTPDVVRNDLIQKYFAGGGVNSSWGILSKNFMSGASGDVVTFTSNAGADGVFSQDELDVLLAKEDVTSINGISKADIEVTISTRGRAAALEDINKMSAGIILGGFQSGKIRVDTDANGIKTILVSPDLSSADAIVDNRHIRITNLTATHIDVEFDGVKSVAFYPEVRAGLRNVLNVDRVSDIFGLVAIGITISSLAVELGRKNGGIPLTTEQLKQALHNSNLNLDFDLLISAAGQIGLDTGIAIIGKMIGGPIALAATAYDLYQNYSALRDSLELAAKVFPKNETLQAAVHGLKDVEAYLSGIFGDIQDAALTDEQRAIIAQKFTDAGVDISMAAGITKDEAAREVFKEVYGDTCFPSGTPVLMGNGGRKFIEDVRVGDLVLAFDGFRDLVPRRVVRTFQNSTTEWLALTFPDAKIDRLVVTPGHAFLTESGDFKTIADILRQEGGEARVVLFNGAVSRVSAELIQYTAECADLFEVAERVAHSDNVILKPEPIGAWQTYNFEVEELHTYVAGNVRVHNDSILDHVGKGEEILRVVLDRPDGKQQVVTESTIGEIIDRVGMDVNNDHVTDIVTQITTYDDDESSRVTQIWSDGDGTIVDGKLVGIGEFEIELHSQIVSGEALGNLLGSALGNAIGDNALQDFIFSTALGTVFGDVGEFLHYLNVDPTASVNGVANVRREFTSDELLGEAFEDFGTKLAGNFVAAGIGQISSFIVDEIIGGRSLAADLGRIVGNSFVSAALTEVAIYAFGNFGGALTSVAGGIPVPGLGFSFNPFTAVASYFGSQLGNSIISPETQNAAIISGIVSSIGSLVGGTIAAAAVTAAGAQIGATAGSVIPVIGTFIGAVIGAVIGTVFGNLVGGKPEKPTAVAYVTVDSEGRLAVPGTGVEFNGGHITDQIPLAEAVRDGLNTLLDGLGGDAEFINWGTNFFFEIGTRAGEGFVYSSHRIVNTRFQDFESLFYAAMEDGLADVQGGDAFGRRIFFYSEWDDYNDLMVNLQVASDYRKYLDAKNVIDSLIARAPDSAFAIGWNITLAQAAAMGLNNPYALHNKIEGTSAAETINGDDRFNDEIIAGAGNDTLRGLVGNDLLTGGAGADVLDGGAGIDTAGYVDSTAGVSVNLATGAASGGDATGDTLISIERLFGSAFDDALTGDALDNVLAGMAGNDTLNGGGGSDFVEGGAGADVMDGGAGYDIANYASSSVGVKVWLQEGATLGGGLGGDAAGDVLVGFEAISGSMFSDVLIGNSEGNLLAGGAGNDFLEGRGGADKLIGDDGSDFADYHTSNAAVSINLATGVIAGGDAEGDQFSSIENIIASAFADTIIGDSGGNIIEGGVGADILDGGAGMDVLSYASSSAGVNVNLITNVVSGGDATGDTVSNFEHIIGSNFSDVLILGSENAIVLAGGGDDIIVPYYKGNVRIDGGEGNDTASFFNVNKAGFFTGFQRGDIEVYQGSDIYAVWNANKAGGNFTAALFAGDRYAVEINSIEWLRATEFDDIISFDDINQFVLGGGGNDIMMGREGADTFDGGDGNDQLYGGLGADDLRGGAGDDTLDGEGKIDTYQPFGNITLYMFPATVTNPDGSQTLVAPVLPAGGNDRLDGGVGNDALRGNGGNDTYVFGRGYGQDTITDYDFKLIIGQADMMGKGSLNVLIPETIDGGQDTLEFASDIRPDDLLVEQVGADLVISIRGTSDKVTLQNWENSFGRVEKFHFMSTGLTYDFTTAAPDSVVNFFSGYTAGEWGHFIDGGNLTGALSGGAGPDTVSYRFAAGAVNVDLTSGGTTGTAAGDTYVNIENVVGTAFADTITGDSGNNIIDGGAGVDTLDGGAGFDILSYVSSSSGVSTSVVGSSVDYFGNPIFGQASGGGDAAGDMVRGFEGLMGSSFADTLSGDAGDNLLIGGRGDDYLQGGIGNDTYRYKLGDGNDTIADRQVVMNLKNPDTYTPGGTDDVLEFGPGISVGDILFGGTSAGIFAVNIYDDAANASIAGSLRGQIGITDWSTTVGTIEHFRFANGLELYTPDIGSYKTNSATAVTIGSGTGKWVVDTTNVTGGTGNDVLVGGNAADAISGGNGNGNDILVGGAGNDTLTGGGGYDRAVVEGSIAGFSITKSGSTWTVTDTDITNRDWGTDTLTTIEEIYFDDARLKLDGTNNVPVVSGSLVAQSVNEDAAFSFIMPTNAFVDPDDTLSYTAKLADGSNLPSWLNFNAATRTFSGTPVNANVGGYSIKVTATDMSAASANAVFTLTVVNTNDSPVALMALVAQNALQSSVFTYTIPAGAFADVDVGDVLSYLATLANGDALPTWLSFNATTHTFSGTPALGDVGELTVKVKVTDSSAASVTSNFLLTVTHVNYSPVASMAIADRNVNEDVVFNYVIPAGTFTDPDVGDTLSYSATLSNGNALPTWLSFNAVTRTFSGTPLNADVSSLSVRVTATDTSASSVSSTFTLSVVNTNDVPVASIALSAQSVTEGSSFSYVVPNGAFTDVDQGDTASYSATLSDGSELPSWLTFDAATKTFSGTPAHSDIGNVTVKVTMTDTVGTSAASVFAMNVVRVNHAPTSGIVIADQTTAEDATFSFTVPGNAFTDEDAGDTLSYAATLADGSALPGWLAFNTTTRTFSGTPLNANVGTISVKVIATDGMAATASSQFSLMVTNTNDAPVASLALANQTANEGSWFTYAVPVGSFTDADIGDSLTYAATLANGSALPSWLSFNATTRTFSGAAGNANVGVLTIKVTASDNSAVAASSNFSLTVVNTNDAPTVAVPLTNQSASEDAAFSYTVPVGTFADIDVGDTLTYSATLSDGSGLPSWLSFNSSTRTFSGTPLNANVGSYIVKVKARDSSAVSASTTFTLTVANTNDAPTVATVLVNQSAAEDAVFSFAVPAGTFADVDVGDSLSYAAILSNGSALPSWLSFNAATRTFSGTPLNTNVDVITVKVTATDGAAASVSSNFTLTVTNTNDAPIVATTLANQSANEDAVFSYTVPVGTFSDVDAGDTLTYSATLADGSALPSWLIFNATTRTFSGTPLNANVGAITVKVKATDGSSENVTTNFTLTVANTNDAPVVATALTNQNALIASAFSYVVPAGTFSDADVGDTLTYSATLADGSALPAWLSFSATTRTFSGTPAVGNSGTISVKVKATDSASAFITSTFSLVVAAGNLGNDVIDGVALSGLFDGGPGSDTVTYATATAAVNVNLATGVGSGAAAGDTYVNIESIVGSAYNDTLIGTGGNNGFQGGAGSDTIDGGAGFDWVTYVDHSAGVTAVLNGGTGVGTVTATISTVADTLSGIEGIIGSAFNDFFNGSANAESFKGMGGIDTASGAGGNDNYYVDLNNRMNITDVVVSQSVLNGKTTTDTLGDAGQDTLYFGSGISLTDIIATQIVSLGTDLGLTIYDDALTSSGANTTNGYGTQIVGWFAYGSAMGTITNPSAGLTRVETFKFADGLTIAAGGISAASSDMSDLASTFTGTATDDWYSARGGNDIVNGNGGNDVLIGGSGNDTINGGAGNDVLAGGSGNDSLTGGAGLDLYSFGRGDGVDAISQTGADASGGKLYFGENIRADQLWFKQVGQDLEVSVIGTTDKISVTGFFAAGAREVTEFNAGGLKLNTASGNTAVSQLVSAMAAFSPPSVGTLDLPSTIRNDASVSTALAAWAA